MLHLHVIINSFIINCSKSYLSSLVFFFVCYFRVLKIPFLPDFCQNLWLISRVKYDVLLSSKSFCWITNMCLDSFTLLFAVLLLCTGVI